MMINRRLIGTVSERKKYVAVLRHVVETKREKRRISR